MKAKPTFEHETCSRCCGTGNYSYNPVSGSRCFGCGGVGYKLTKRGRAAQNFLNAMREMPLENFEIGDLIRFDGFHAGSYVEPTRWAKVIGKEIVPATEAGYLNCHDKQCVRIDTTHGQVVGFANGKSIWRKGFTAEQKQAQVDQALAYQATLTKTGKPSKQKLAA